MIPQSQSTVMFIKSRLIFDAEIIAEKLHAAPSTDTIVTSIPCIFCFLFCIQRLCI